MNEVQASIYDQSIKLLNSIGRSPSMSKQSAGYILRSLSSSFKQNPNLLSSSIKSLKDQTMKNLNDYKKSTVKFQDQNHNG